MQPQGLSAFNKAYFDALTIRINAITDCSELQAAVNDAFGAIQAQSDAITAQMATIAPMLALLKPPTSLAAIISWLSTFITSFLTPYLKPYITYAVQVAELAAAIAALTEAVRHASLHITTCTISVPTVTAPVPPVLDASVLQ